MRVARYAPDAHDLQRDAWIERQGVGQAAKQNTPGLLGSGVSVSVGAGTGFEPVTFRL